jgi:hypothetical protein
MKAMLAAVAAAAILGTGCVGVVGVHSSGAKASKKCPPGHEWSDGQCHSTGKGHDPARKAK